MKAHAFRTVPLLLVAIWSLPGCRHESEAPVKPAISATPTGKPADPADPNYVPPVKPTNPEITTPGKNR